MVKLRFKVEFSLYPMVQGKSETYIDIIPDERFKKNPIFYIKKQ